MDMAQFYKAIDTVKISVISDDTGISRQALHRIRKRDTKPSIDTFMAFEKNYQQWMLNFKYVKR